MTNSNSIIECGQEKAFIICGLCRKPFCFIDFSLLLGKWNLDCALEKLARSPLSVAAEAFVTRRSALLSVRRAQLVVLHSYNFLPVNIGGCDGAGYGKAVTHGYRTSVKYSSFMKRTEPHAHTYTHARLLRSVTIF